MLPSTPMQVPQRAEKGRKMLSATIVIKKGIINQIVGLRVEERQGKAHK